MITFQVVPRPGLDAYQLVRHKVIHEARTWSWANKRKTRLRHAREEAGTIEVGHAGGVLTARVHPKGSDDLFFLTEKFVGRLVAWFKDDLAAINLQFPPPEPIKPKRRRKR
jgi:hypothetical protein